MLVTLLASKLDKSNDCNDEQDLNIYCISVTLLASKLDKSNDCNDKQLSNILFMLVTLLVSKPVDKLQYIKLFL